MDTLATCAGRTTDEGSASATTKPSDGELHERLSSVKEAIAHLHEVPEAERGTGWYAYRDVLESKRAGLSGTGDDPSLVGP